MSLWDSHPGGKDIVLKDKALLGAGFLHDIAVQPN